MLTGATYRVGKDNTPGNICCGYEVAESYSKDCYIAKVELLLLARSLQIQAICLSSSSRHGS